MASKCENVALELASTLGPGLSEGAQSHSDDCAFCQNAVLEAAALQPRLAHLKRSGDEQMHGIDLSVRLLETIEAPTHPWRIRFAIAAAFATVVAIWLWPGGGNSTALLVSLDAPRGVQLAAPDGARVAKGKHSGLALPLTLATESQQSASLRIASATIEIAPNTKLSLNNLGEL